MQTLVRPLVPYTHYPLGQTMSFHREEYEEGYGYRMDRTVLREFAFPFKNGNVLAVHEVDEHVIYEPDQNGTERDLFKFKLSRIVIHGYLKAKNAEEISGNARVSLLEMIEDRNEQREIEQLLQEVPAWKELAKKTAIFFSSERNLYK